ncbi:hypothetical protein LCGC14_1695570 [marine sediment metagenome]|uniref:Uncharacterized protein n=1 Tax=marine sediment metagenome TaxID=412755 RepID=A0A0F9K002_9ZZZZ
MGEFVESERNQRKENAMKKLILILFLVFAVSGFAQEPAEPTEEPKAVELTELESAKLSVLIKDVQLSQLQIQIVQSQYQTAVGQRDARQARLNALLDGFRELHSAPTDKFTFDAVKMVFVPIPQESEREEAKTEKD